MKPTKLGPIPMPEPMPVKVIVASTHKRGRDRARDLGLNPLQVTIVCDADAAQATRADEYHPAEVYWDQGWWEGMGEQADAVRLTVGTRIRKPGLDRGGLPWRS